MTQTTAGDRRTSLVQAATRVFAAKGFRAASVSDIIAEAGVARGTFYLYFESKTAAFMAVIDSFTTDLRRLSEQHADQAKLLELLPVPEAARILFAAWLKYFSEHRDLAAVLFQHGASVDPEYKDKCREALAGLYAFWEARIEEHQRAGITNPGLEPSFIRSALVGMFAQLVLDKVVRDGRTDLEALADQWSLVLSHGIFTQAAPPQGGPS